MRTKLAKRANQRIVRLERTSSKVTGESFSAFGAITDAYEYLERQQSGRKRFSENKGFLDDINALRREVTVLQGFLGRKTSLVTGMRDIEKRRIETFQSGKWGTLYKFTGSERKALEFSSTKEFYDFLNSSTYRGLIKAGFTSEQMVEAYDNARELHDGMDEEVIAAMEKALQDYRNGQSLSLKDLKERLGMRKVT